MEKMPFTREGLEKLKAELQHLERVERPKNIQAISEARGHGDISENAEYHAAKDRQSFLEGRINELKAAIGKAEVIEIDDAPDGRAVFGREVLLYNVQTDEEVVYRLVGHYEADPEEGRISVNSPLGRAIVGREVGDALQVQTPKGIQEFEILEIR